MADEIPRTRDARAAAEAALVRVVHHYGERPEFVLLGGLVPEYLCSGSDFQHAGTIDVDVQVDLEIAAGTANAPRLERALRNADFEPDGGTAWRWAAVEDGTTTPVVKFELLADDFAARSGEVVVFDDCEVLGAVNLRGTGFASRDVVTHGLTASIGAVNLSVEINVTGLAGFLVAKTAAAWDRRKPKDWYDIAFVLLHNDAGGPEQAARSVLERFDRDLVGPIRTALHDLAANFNDPGSQGPRAYVSQTAIDHPELDRATTAADAVVAVKTFYGIVTGGSLLSNAKGSTVEEIRRTSG